jgi:predicted ATP-dependent serine protease
MSTTKTRTRNRKSKKTEFTVPATLSRKVTPTTMEKVDIDPRVFEKMITDSTIDAVFTNQGGISKAANYMVIGDPGIGKSTVLLDILANLHQRGYKVLFISGEMGRIDLAEYCRRFPKFNSIPILFTADYIDENPKLVIEEILKEGYDLVVMDSMVEVQETVQTALEMRSREADKWLLDLIAAHNEGHTIDLDKDGNPLHKTGKYTTFLLIQQMTKGGKFVGSNRLKHMTTGLMELRFDRNGESFLFFDKNRRGPKAKRLYFDLSDDRCHGDVFYDAERFIADEDAATRSAEEVSRLRDESAEFDNMFGIPNANEEIVVRN